MVRILLNLVEIVLAYTMVEFHSVGLTIEKVLVIGFISYLDNTQTFQNIVTTIFQKTKSLLWVGVFLHIKIV